MLIRITSLDRVLELSKQHRACYVPRAGITRHTPAIVFCNMPMRCVSDYINRGMLFEKVDGQSDDTRPDVREAEYERANYERDLAKDRRATGENGYHDYEVVDGEG